MASVADGGPGGGAALPLPNTHVRSLVGHTGAVFCVRFNSDSQYCMTAGNDRTIKLWNPHRDTDLPEDARGVGGRGAGKSKAGQAATGAPHAMLIKTYAGIHSHPVSDIAIGHDNSKFASCGGDRSAFLWDVATGKMVRKYYGHEGRINAVAFNAESTVLVTGSYDQTMRAWDCRSFNRTPIQVMKHFKDSVSTVTCTRNEIIAGSIDGCVRVYDLRAGKLRVDTIHDPVVSVGLSHDGKCMLVGVLAGKAAARLVLLEKDSGECLNHYKGHDNSSYPIQSGFTNSDAYVASGSEDGNIHFWDLVQGGSSIHTLRGHKRAVCSLAFHKDAPFMLSASYDGTVRVWRRR